MDNTFNGLLEAAARITPQWLAGFFDGEGTVCTRDGNSGVPGVVVSISQKDSVILSLIHVMFDGGSLSTNNRNVSGVEWSGRDCIKILEFVKDHVICKRKQVELGLEIAKLTLGPGKSLGEDAKEQRISLAEQLKPLNVRGNGGAS